MAITTFVRKEKKYLITEEQRRQLLEILPKHMVFDKYCQNGNMYTVNNVYFDTPTFNVIRNSLSKPAYKSKLRIRTYITKAQDDDVAFLETAIDEMETHLPPMTHFVLPGGHTTVSYCHIARCVCRRSERLATHLNDIEPTDEMVLKYLNRLSDYLFVLARKLSFDLKADEVKWIPEKL